MGFNKIPATEFETVHGPGLIWFVNRVFCASHAHDAALDRGAINDNVVFRSANQRAVRQIFAQGNRNSSQNDNEWATFERGALNDNIVFLSANERQPRLDPINDLVSTGFQTRTYIYQFSEAFIASISIFKANAFQVANYRKSETSMLFMRFLQFSK